MTMTRQHFALIANVVHDLHLMVVASEGDADKLQASLARRFANELAPTNTAFKRERFLRACGVEG